MPSLLFARRRRRAAPPAAAAGAAVVVAGALGAVAGRRRRSSALPAAPATAPPASAAPGLPAAGPADAALGTLGAQPDLPQGVAEAYRSARRAFNAAREVPEEGPFARLHEEAAILWCCATIAEQEGAAEAKPLARQTRELLGVLEERRDLLRLRAAIARSGRLATGPAAEAHAMARIARLEGRALKRGRRLFAAKPARVAARIHAGINSGG